MTITDTAAPRIAPPKAACDHFVQFYDRDRTLIESLGRYFRNGLEAGGAAIMIATPQHVQQLLELWSSEGFDPARARERGQLVVLDAAQTLASLSIDGAPNVRLFEERIGPVIAEASGRFGHVLAFGEMVGLLWAESRFDDAVRLESFWNLLAQRHSFALYCAYRMSDCANAQGTAAFEAVCAAHSHVTPAESYFEHGDEPAQLRHLAQLQHRAGALQREVEARQHAEQELADFLENAVIGLHRVGPDGTILWANATELAMLGYAREDYVGRNIADFHWDADVLASIMERLGAGETLRDQPATLRCKDGSVRQVLISSNALIRDGKLIATRCFTRDVSDRWLAQEALRERGAVLHLAMQGARMGYWVGDLVRGTLRGSHELAMLLGLSGTFEWDMDQFLGLVHPQDREVFRARLREAIDRQREFLVEFRVRTEASGWRWFEGRGEAIYVDAIPTRFYGVCMDITARKRADETLAHMAAVVDSADDAILSKTLQGIVKSWNRGAERIFGYSAAEIVGKPITTLIPPELHPEETQILAKIRAGERVEHYVTTRVAKDGTRKRISITVSPVRNSAGEIIGASKIGRELGKA